MVSSITSSGAPLWAALALPPMPPCLWRWCLWAGKQDWIVGAVHRWRFCSLAGLPNNNEMQFTSEIDRDKIPFLDIMISKTMSVSLETTIYRKPTTTKSLLHWNSGRPTSLKKGIPYGQYLCLRRNCSTKSEFRKQSKELQIRFLDKGYLNHVLKNVFQRALHTDRLHILAPKKRATDSDISQLAHIIGTFDDRAGCVKNILAKHWDILRMDHDNKKFIGTYPSVTYRQGSNLRDRHYTPPTKPECWLTREVKGCFRGSGCVACKYIKTGRSFSSNVTKETFEIQHYIRCRSTGVIYWVHCACGLEYVGKTSREVRRRIREHLGDIRHRCETPFPGSSGHSIRVTPRRRPR